MARKRFVSPEFFTHGELYDAEVATGLPLRLAYAGLWTLCDRRGLFWWKPREMKLQVMPYDAIDFEAVLWALESKGFIEVYVVDGKRFGFVPSFDRWQSFHKNEQPSDVPEPSNGRRESSNGRPETSLSVAVAVAVTGTTSTTGTTATGADVADATPRPDPVRRTERSRRPAPNFPHFPKAVCDAAYQHWQSSAGAVDYARFRKAFGPLFTADEAERPTGYPRDAELVPAVQLYLAATIGTREAAFRSPDKCAAALSGMVDVLRSTTDPLVRIDHAQVHLGIGRNRGMAA